MRESKPSRGGSSSIFSIPTLPSEDDAFIYMSFIALPYSLFFGKEVKKKKDEATQIELT